MTMRIFTKQWNSNPEVCQAKYYFTESKVLLRNILIVWQGWAGESYHSAVSGYAVYCAGDLFTSLIRWQNSVFAEQIVIFKASENTLALQQDW